jgi:hypothetical protein
LKNSGAGGTGEPLVERTYPVRVPFGQRQRELHDK